MSCKRWGAGQDGELPVLRDFVQIVRQTAACTNHECIYTNVAQGTPCDDQQFCTATDECGGWHGQAQRRHAGGGTARMKAEG